MPAARSRDTAVVKRRPVGGHPGQEAALAGRLHAVAAEPLEHLGVRTDPGEPGRDDGGGQAGVAGERRGARAGRRATPLRRAASTIRSTAR